MTLPGLPEPTAAASSDERRRSRRAPAVVYARDLDWSQVKVDTWLVAGTPVGDPYPCLCQQWAARQGYTYCGRHCPCAGRDDTAHLPETCCAVRPRGRRQTSVAAPLPLPPASALRRSKLRSPAPVSAVELLVAGILVSRATPGVE